MMTPYHTRITFKLLKALCHKAFAQVSDPMCNMSPSVLPAHFLVLGTHQQTRFIPVPTLRVVHYTFPSISIRRPLQTKVGPLIRHITPHPFMCLFHGLFSILFCLKHLPLLEIVLPFNGFLCAYSALHTH